MCAGIGALHPAQDAAERGEAERAGIAFDPFLSYGCISVSDVVCNAVFEEAHSSLKAIGMKCFEVRGAAPPGPGNCAAMVLRSSERGWHRGLQKHSLLKLSLSCLPQTIFKHEELCSLHFVNQKSQPQPLSLLCADKAASLLHLHLLQPGVPGGLLPRGCSSSRAGTPHPSLLRGERRPKPPAPGRGSARQPQSRGCSSLLCSLLLAPPEKICGSNAHPRPANLWVRFGSAILLGLNRN